MKHPRPLGILTLASRSILHHRLTTVVTVLSVAMATGLVMAVFALQDQSRRAVEQSDGGFDAVLGARGSALQLVLNAVYHLESSQGNLPWSVYQAIAADPRVAEAVPLVLGDNYFGYRIIGTTAEHLEGRHRDDRPRFAFAAGRRFEWTRARPSLAASSPSGSGWPWATRSSPITASSSTRGSSTRRSTRSAACSSPPARPATV